MTQLRTVASSQTRRRGPSVLARRPEVLPIALAVVGWSALIAAQVWPHGVADGASHAPAHAAGHVAASGVSATWAAGGLAAMTVAMMSPLAVPGARTVGFSSRWWRAGRAVGWFVAAFTAGWLVATVPLAWLAAIMTAGAGTATTTVSLLLSCAALQLLPRRARWASACDRPMRVRASGRGADADCVRFGLLTTARGLPLCGPPMVAMLAAPGGLPIMLAISAAVLVDGVTQGRAAVAVAGGYAAIAAAVVMWT